MDTDVHRNELILYLRFTLGQFDKTRQERMIKCSKTLVIVNLSDWYVKILLFYSLFLCIFELFKKKFTLKNFGPEITLLVL